MSDRRKRSYYLPSDYVAEIAHQAERLDRSMSYILQQAWLVARDTIGCIPGPDPVPVPVDTFEVKRAG